MVCSFGFWCLECLGFEVLRVRVFLMEFRVSGFQGCCFLGCGL